MALFRQTAPRNYTNYTNDTAVLTVQPPRIDAAIVIGEPAVAGTTQTAVSPNRLTSTSGGGRTFEQPTNTEAVISHAVAFSRPLLGPTHPMIR